MWTMGWSVTGCLLPYIWAHAAPSGVDFIKHRTPVPMSQAVAPKVCRRLSRPTRADKSTSSSDAALFLTRTLSLMTPHALRRGLFARRHALSSHCDHLATARQDVPGRVAVAVYHE